MISESLPGKQNLLNQAVVKHALQMTLAASVAAALAIAVLDVILRWRLAPQPALIAAASAAAAIMLNRSGLVGPSLLLATSGIVYAVMHAAAKNEGIQNVGIAIIPMLIAVASLLLDRRALALFTASAILAAAVMLVTRYYFLRLENYSKNDLGDFLIFAITCATAAVIGRFLSNGIERAIADERSQSEDALRQNKVTIERQLREIEAIYDAAPVGLAVLDTDLRWVRMNDRMAEINGPAVEEHLGRSVPEVLPDLAPRLEALLRQVIETGEPVMDLEIWGTTPAQPGSVRTWMVNYRALNESDGRAGGINAVVQEITDWKRAEASLRENAIRQSLILEAGGSGVWEWDIQTGRAIFSAAYTRFLGYDPESFVSTYEAWKDLLHPDDLDRVEQHIADHFAGHTDYSIEVRMKEKSGKWHWILSRGLLIERDSGGKPVRMVGTHVDIQPLKRAEEERENLQKQLAHAQKMESIGRLAGGLAHDFNNIMNVILLNADSALQEISTEDGAQDSLVAIQDAAERAVALGQQLMAFSSKQVHRTEALNLNSVIADCEMMMRRLIGEDVQVVFKPGESLPSVRADRGQVGQIIMNLAVNARDAMPEGGTFMIETGVVDFDRADAQINSDAPSGPYVLLSISDTGIGMDNETQARLFEPFFTTKGVGKGTGLGLSVVYGIVKQSGGFIRVVSEPGSGTEFRIYLPSVSDAPASIPDAEQRPVQGGSETILLVEDEPALRRKLQQILEQAGYEVLVAADGEQAHQLASPDTFPIDLLLTDMVMPRISGLRLAERLLKGRPQMKVLYMSGYPHAPDGSAQTLQLPPGFLQKPFTRDRLLRRLRESLDEGATLGV